VAYDVGSIRGGKVKGFAVDHYDKSPSPLSAAGGGTASIFGPGGVIDGAADVLDSLASGEAFESPANFLSAAITAVNTYQNTKGLTNAGVRQEGKNLLIGGTIAVAAAGLSGLKNVVFPSRTGNGNTTQANQVDL
jgi:hypothetical protein